MVRLLVVVEQLAVEQQEEVLEVQLEGAVVVKLLVEQEEAVVLPLVVGQL